MLSLQGMGVGRRMDHGDLDGAAIPENQSHTAITSSNGQDPQPRRKDIKIDIKQSDIQLH